MRVGCIIQARLESKRLPRKVLADIGGWPMIRHVWERMTLVNIPVVIATPSGEGGEVYEIYKALNGKALVEGPDCPSEDVLTRYLLIAKAHGFDAIMRVTGDCPLIDPEACKAVLDAFNSNVFNNCYPGIQYVANDFWPSYPDGLGCEVFSRSALAEAAKWAKPGNQADWEHVTPWIKRGVHLGGGRRYCGLNIRCPIPGLEDLKFSVDTEEDLGRVRKIDARLPGGHLKYALESTLEAWERVKDAP
jgi:spore coat polysaccharide biosynthesis protein SpsF (cytidylyltransferase family)